MAGYHFFAMLSRMKYINRWGLMRNTQNENISEHSHNVAVTAHALAVIKNKYFGGNVNAERTALLAIFHDVPEIITGDLPTPVKYYNPLIRSAYGKVEEVACNKLLDMLPDDMREDYGDLFFHNPQDEELWKLVKAADKISALVKCIEEEKAGNHEFSKAYDTLKKAVGDLKMPEVDYYVEKFLPSFSLTLDEQD